MSKLRAALPALLARENLSPAAARAALSELLSGRAEPILAAAFLTALQAKGAAVAELSALARLLRAKAAPLSAPKGAVDTCGTGGDMAGTLNISTAASFVVAAAGVPVAKHGNRAASSRCGAADVLEALGLRLDMPKARVQQALKQLQIGFMFAPAWHGALAPLAPLRKMLGVPTIFNLVGPLVNPARVRFQLLGVAQAPWLDLMGASLQQLGVARAWLVHGAGGLDEVSLSGPTEVLEVTPQRMRRFRLEPQKLGVRPAPVRALRGGTAANNARRLTAVLDGKPSAYRDSVRLNAAAALCVAGRCPNMRAGLQLATEMIDSGAAAHKLHALVAFSQKARHG